MERSEQEIYEEASARFLKILAADSLQQKTERLVELDCWLTESPLHREAFDRVELAWQAVGENAAAPDFVSARGEVLERTGRAARGHWRAGFSVRRLGGVAALVLLLLSVIPLLQFFKAEQTGATQSYITDIGEKRVITLADNSLVELDAQTRLKVSYSSQQRTVRLLSGQAHFDVAKDKRRPFSVIAGKQEVVALGTAFNMALFDDRLSVTLIEGRVAVISKEVGKKGDAVKGAGQAAALKLLPGQKLVVSREGRYLQEAASIEKATAWRHGKLIFDNDPLLQVIAQMNRYSHEKIRLNDKGGIGALGISGTFNAGDTEAFVEALEAYFPVAASRPDNQTIWLRAAK